MEFEGRIIRVLPVRSGTSQRGEWKALPFVFAYYETQDQRWEDRVLLESFDTNVMAQIAKFCEVGSDKKVVVENGSVKLKTLDIKCKCGFSHNTRDITTQSGEQRVINEMRCYKLEVIQQQIPSGNAAGASAQQPAAYQSPQMPFGETQQGGGEDDDLPF